MIHRYVDLLEGCRNRGVAVSGPGGGGANAAVWLMSHNVASVEITNSRSFGSSFLADPTISPDYCLTLFSYIPNSGTINYVTTVPTDDSGAAIDIGSSDNNIGGPPVVSLLSLQPSWHPSGQQVVFRGIEGAPTNSGPPTIERVDYDGSNATTLIPGVVGTSTSPYRYPFYSSDGTKILFYQDRGNILDIFTADADGSNDVLVAQTVDTGTSVPIWIPGTTTVCYTTSTGTTGSPLTGSQQVRTVEADGTGDTLLYTDPEVQNINNLWSTTPYAALPDGSGILYAQWFPGDPSFFDYRLGIIDTGGGGWTELSPQRVTAGFEFNVHVPVFRNGRIWWDDGMFGAGGDGIVSVMADGSDYTVEDNTLVFDMNWFG